VFYLEFCRRPRPCVDKGWLVGRGKLKNVKVQCSSRALTRTPGANFLLFSFSFFIFQNANTFPHFVNAKFQLKLIDL